MVNLSFRDLDFHYFGLKFSILFAHSWHLRKRSILSGWRSASTSKTLMNPRTGRISSLAPLRTFRESAANKVSISDYTLNFVPAVSTCFCSFVNVALISFILKCYPFFCVNFLHSTVAFHYTVIRNNLSGVNFQYRNFMESYVYFL